MNPEWTSWAKNTIRLLADGAYMVYPLGGKGVAFKVDKTNHQLITLCEHPSYTNSNVARLNVQVFNAIGYDVIRTEPVPTDLQATVERLAAETSEGTTLVDANVIDGISKIFGVHPTAVEKMLHTASGSKKPINPITVRGHDSDDKPVGVALGRLWISSGALGEGQHKFDAEKGGHDLEKTMQFVVFTEEPTNMIAGLVGDEDEFIAGAKKLRNVQGGHFTVTGTREPNKRVVFARFAEKLVISFFDGPSRQSLLKAVGMSFDHFDRGLDHLFVRGELATPENN